MKFILFVLLLGLLSVTIGSARRRPRPGGVCSSYRRCPRFQCCVNPFKPRGKRSDDLVTGNCQNLGREGDSNRQDGTGLYFACPCARGYECRGSGLVEAPLGEIGTCRRFF